MGDNLKNKMIGALAWSSVDRLGQQLIQFVIGILLARMLCPSDYGLIGMIAVFASISFIVVDGGFSAALIRKKETSELDYNSVFYLNLFVSLLLYGISFIAMPFIAIFFEQPRLTLVGRVTFLGIIFNSLYLVSYAQCSKAMDFKKIAKVNILAILFSGGLSLILAFKNYGVWALVVQQTGYHFFRMLGFLIFVRWFPKLQFSLAPIKEFWHFSIHLLFTSFLTAIYNNLYTFLIGKFYHITQVGYHTQAHKMSETSNFTFQSILNHSTYNLFVRIYDDNERLKRIYKSVTKKISLVVVPITMILIVIAMPLFYVLLSEKWLNAVPYFQLICIGNLFAPLYLINTNVLNAQGQSRLTLRLELSKWVLVIIAIALFLNKGIFPLLAGFSAAYIINYFISVIIVTRQIGISISAHIKLVMPSILLGLACALTYFLSPFIDNLYLLLLTQVICTLVIYFSILHIFFKEELEWLLYVRNEK